MNGTTKAELDKVVEVIASARLLVSNCYGYCGKADTLQAPMRYVHELREALAKYDCRDKGVHE